MRTLIEKTFFTIVVAAAVFGIVFGVVRMVSAFTEPTQSPPGGNVPAPVNVGGSAQTKSGSFNSLGGLFDNNVRVCKEDGSNCPGALTGTPTILKYKDPNDGKWIGPADFCVLESFRQSDWDNRSWCFIDQEQNNLFRVRRRYAFCTWICVRW